LFFLLLSVHCIITRSALISSRLTNFLVSLTSEKWRLFVFLWIAVAILYLPSYKAGFVADFFNALVRYHEGSFSYFLNREGAYVRSLYQFTQLQLYALISLFGVHPVPWFLLFTGLHALNGTFLFLLLRRLLTSFGIRRCTLIAVSSALLFLFNPNITEVTIWKGGYHYLTGVLMQLFILLCCLRYLSSHQSRYTWLAGIVFALSTYTLEIFYATPFLTLFLILGYRWKALVDFRATNKAILYFFLPQLVLFLIHLVTFRLVYGSWVAHYGSTSDFAIHLHDVLPRFGKYLFYLVFMGGHIREDLRIQVYDVLSQPLAYYALLLLFLGLASYLLFRFKKLQPFLQIFAFLFAGLLCGLVLATPIWFDDSFSLYNSRRCYHTGLFLYPILALFIFSIFQNIRFSVLLFAAYLLVCISLTVNMVFRWRRAAGIQYGVLRTFRWQSSDPVLLLNIPTYYKDVRIIPAGEGNEFNKQLKIFGHDTVAQRLYSVSSYNMQNYWDGAHVTVLDSLSIKVTLNQSGSWWMYNYRGATNYENDLYKVTFGDSGMDYLLQLKSRPPGMVILFQQGEEWRVVDMNRRNVEQWD